MPRPEKITEENLKVRQAQLAQKKTKLDEDYAGDKKNSALGLLEQCLGLSEKQSMQHAQSLIDLLNTIHLEYLKFSESSILRSQPIIEGVQVTAGEMAETLKPMAIAAKALNDAAQKIPSELLEHLHLSLSEYGGELYIDLKKVIADIADLVTGQFNRHKDETVPGPKVSDQSALCRYASDLIRFAKEIVPHISESELHDFIDSCLVSVGVPHPLPTDKEKFATFFFQAKLFADLKDLNFVLGSIG